MPVAIALRGDFSAKQLRSFAKKTKDCPQARRLLALAAIYDGAPRAEAAKMGGVASPPAMTNSLETSRLPPRSLASFTGSSCESRP